MDREIIQIVVHSIVEMLNIQTEIMNDIETRIHNQQLLNSGTTIHFGSILPIYAYGERRFTDEDTSKTASIYGFEDGRFIKVPCDKFEEHQILEEELKHYVHREDRQFNSHLIGDDTNALRMAMMLMDEEETIETLKDIYDKIHAIFVMGLRHDWETILRYEPSLKERYDRKRPKNYISERLFGKFNKEYERFVQRVKIKSIDRIPENTNKNTFDYIQVEVLLSGTLPQETLRYLCKKYGRAIGRHVLMVIGESPRFQKFGVPVNILKIEKATLVARESMLYITIEIKGRQ